jgi:ribosome maturation protein Sdo1
MVQLDRLIYTPTDVMTSDEHPKTFVMMVDGDMYERQKTDKSIPLAQIVDNFRVFMYEKPGHSGKMVEPSQAELEAAFGTTNMDVLCQFMLINGQPHGHPRSNFKPPGDPHRIY